MSTAFVDRTDDLALLRSVAAGVGTRQGFGLVIEGRSGIGKSALLRRFVEETGGGSADSIRVVYTTCRAHTGQGLAFGPIIALLSAVTSGGRPGTGRRRGLGKVLTRAGRGAAQAAPEVLASLVPGLGPLMPLIRSITESALSSGNLPGDSLQPFQQAIVLRVAEEIGSRARKGRPLVVVIDDIQYIDESSLQVLDLILQRLDGEPLAVVLGLTTGLPAGTLRHDVSDLVARWHMEDVVRRHQVGPLPGDAIAELVALRYEDASAEFVARVAEVTGGLPLFVRLCLDSWRPQDGVRGALPESVAEAVRRQLKALTDADRGLLSLAAVQGSVFLSHVLARSAETPHEDVLERLRLLSLDKVLIVPADCPDWAEAEASDIYRFDHLLLWSSVYRAQTIQQRRLAHKRVAAVFAAMIDEYDVPPTGMRLEQARHLELAGPDCAGQSAEVRLTLARSAAVGGLSFAEAEMHCTVAIEAVNVMRPGRERDRLLVEAVEMLLSMTEVRWRGRSAEAGGADDVDGLAARAEAAAARDGSPELIAVTTLLRGKTLLATAGVVSALPKLKRAVDLADQLGDPVRAYVARVEYGRQLGKRDLAAALDVLRDVEFRYASDRALNTGGGFVLQHARNLAEMQLAVNLLDAGHVGEALDRLERCVARLRSESLNAELPIAFNYLAQAQLTVGRFEEAKGTLREALAYEERRGGDSGWHAYNQALLAFAVADEQGAAARSVDLVQQAWLETERTWLVNLVPIVRNLFVDVLIAAERQSEADPDERARILRQAADLATETCRETLGSGMVRSRIAALSLLSRIHLRAARPDRAANFARESVEVLDAVGDMPALRTEEVCYHAAVVLAANGDSAEARLLLERARRVIAAKAERIEDPAMRQGFLHDVPLNRWIEEGLEAGGAQAAGVRL